MIKVRMADGSWGSAPNTKATYKAHGIESHGRICGGSFIDDMAQIATGAIVYPNAYILRGASVGENVKVHPRACVGEGSTIEDGCMIEANVTVSSDVFIAAGVTVPYGAYIPKNAKVVRDPMVIKTKAFGLTAFADDRGRVIAFGHVGDYAGTWILNEESHGAVPEYLRAMILQHYAE